MRKIVVCCLMMICSLAFYLFGCGEPQHTHEYVEHICSCGVVETFTVKFEHTEGGTLEGETEQIVEYGKQTTQVKAVADVGYKFVGWSDNVSDAIRVIEVESDLTLTATFTIITHTVNFSAGEGGTIQGETEQVVEFGESTTKVKAIPDDGYNFLRWSDGVGDQERTLQPETDLNLTAIFTSLPIHIATFESDKNGSIDGKAQQRLAYGETSSVVVAVPNVGYKFKEWSDGVTEAEREIEIFGDVNLTATFEMEYLELPVFIINTENSKAITSKEIYVPCTITVDNADEEYCFENYTAQIRGRGNSSWGFPKKPYKLQFVESSTNGKKVNLFGNGSAKTWTLIADYADLSLSRNALAYKVGSLIDEIADTTTTTQPVEVYLNGSYDGVYLLCEQMQTGKNRVDIEEDLENGVNTGYLLEIDGRAKNEGVEGIDWFKVRNVPFAIKTPDTEDELYTTDFVEYIQNYITQCFDLLDTNYQQACELIDMESFASGYILHELFKSCDVGYYSFYVHKDKDGKLKCGPVWDFDFSSGNCGWVDLQPEKMIAASSNIFFKLMLKHQQFKDLVAEKLSLYGYEIFVTIRDYYDEVMLCKNSYERNFKRWDSCREFLRDYGEYGQPEEILAIDTWEGQVIYLQEWLHESLDYIYQKYEK